MILSFSLLLLLYYAAQRWGTSTPRILQETRCHTSLHHLDQWFFRQLVKFRLLELPSKRVRFWSLGICILTSKPGNSGADAQVTMLGETLGLDYLLCLRSEAVDQMNSQVSSSLMIPTFPPCLSDVHLSYLRWLLW